MKDCLQRFAYKMEYNAFPQMTGGLPWEDETNILLIHSPSEDQHQQRNMRGGGALSQHDKGQCYPALHVFKLGYKSLP